MKEHYCILLIFGATGDLTSRKLLPALYFMEQESQLKQNFKIICIARREKSSQQYRSEALESIKKFSRVKVREEILSRLMSRILYFQLEFSNQNNYMKLKKIIENISGGNCHNCERIFYLAVAPQFFKIIVDNLKHFGLAEKKAGANKYNRVMFEKPFGRDLKSAKELNNSITKVFDEKQIYRIDHYMAKELVQNLLVLRFANSIFEPLWNKEYIDHVQITVAETLGVEGRGDYYDKFGALRDVIQNHMMQLLTLVAMAAPKTLASDDVKNEKVKVLKSVSRLAKKNLKNVAVIGQYGEGLIDGKKVHAYRAEREVGKDSKTETYHPWRG